MPASWEIRDRILIVTVVGDWSNLGPAAAITEALADPRFQPDTSLLLDVRLSETNPSSEEVRFRAEWMASLRSKGLSSQCAIVVGPKIYQFGMARMAATYLEFQGMALEIFSDMDEAVRWLSHSNSRNSNATG